MPVARGRALAVGASYFAQGLGYASVVTALPSFKTRLGLDDTAVSLLLLGTCVGAAAGSILADFIAVRAGSRQALCAGLAAEAVAIGVIAFAPGIWTFLIAIAVYGVGVGAVDASSNMQGVLLERGTRMPVLGRLYAAYTCAAIAGAVTMSAVLASSGAVTGALCVAVTVAAGVAWAGWHGFDPARAARKANDPGASVQPLPRRGIWMAGSIVLAAFVLDSAVSSWSSIYLADGLRVTAAAAPLAYAVYQGAVLVSRLGADPLVSRFGRFPTGVTAAAAGVGGCVLVATVPTIGGAVAGFGIAGIATGVLVPIAFAAAGELLPERSDEVIARVNLFNYAGAVIVAVLLGLVGGQALGTAFLIPAVVLAASSPLLRWMVRGRLVPTAATEQWDGIVE